VSKFTEIQAALDGRLATLAPAPPIAWENVRYTPTEGTTYLRPTNLPGAFSAVGMASGDTERTTGIYQIDVFAPSGDGPGAALAQADAVAAHFPKFLRLTRGNTAVTLGVPAIEPALPRGAWLQVAVVIPYDAFTKE